MTHVYVCTQVSDVFGACIDIYNININIIDLDIFNIKKYMIFIYYQYHMEYHKHLIIMKIKNDFDKM